MCWNRLLKSDCKQPLRIGIIRALNECTGRLFRATTRHNHKSSDMQSKKISNDQELIQSDPISCPQNQKGILKSDCKQPLRIGIIRALNECTGRFFRATTRHNHKSSDMQSKKISNDQELIQSDPISCPQNQKGIKMTTHV